MLFPVQRRGLSAAASPDRLAAFGPGLFRTSWSIRRAPGTTLHPQSRGLTSDHPWGGTCTAQPHKHRWPRDRSVCDNCAEGKTHPRRKTDQGRETQEWGDTRVRHVFRPRTAPGWEAPTGRPHSPGGPPPPPPEACEEGFPRAFSQDDARPQVSAEAGVRAWLSFIKPDIKRIRRSNARLLFRFSAGGYRFEPKMSALGAPG